MADDQTLIREIVLKARDEATAQVAALDKQMHGLGQCYPCPPPLASAYPRPRS
jgi:hypothetical protein